MLTPAEHILDSKAGEFDPATFRDRYEEAPLAHLKAKQAGAVPERRKDLCPAASGGQSHGGIASQRRRGHQRRRSALQRRRHGRSRRAQSRVESGDHQVAGLGYGGGTSQIF
jgi:DNA end-binding protein Ku